MPNLLECLLNSHEDINKAIEKLFNKAQKNLKVEAELSGDDAGGDEFGEELERLIIEEQLPKINLLNVDTYNRLLEKASNWYIPFEGNEELSAKWAPVQSVLVNRLEYFRELQQNPPDECSILLAGCTRYLKHLEAIAQKEERELQQPSHDGYARLEGKKSKKNTKAVQQIAEIRALIAILKSNEDSETRLQNFQVKYKAKKRIIESGHDSFAANFKKVVESIKYVLKGKARKVSGLWKTKGKELTDHVQTAIKPPYKKI